MHDGVSRMHGRPGLARATLQPVPAEIRGSLAEFGSALRTGLRSGEAHGNVRGPALVEAAGRFPETGLGVRVEDALGRARRHWDWRATSSRAPLWWREYGGGAGGRPSLAGRVATQRRIEPPLPSGPPGC